MAYATITDLYDSLPRSLVDAQEADDPGSIARFLGKASDKADSLFAAHFKVPLASPSPAVVDTVCAIAAYNLMAARGYNPEAGADPTLRDRYKDALKWLTDVSNDIANPTEPGSEPDPAEPYVLSAPQGGDVEFGDVGFSMVGGITIPSRRGW